MKIRLLKSFIFLLIVSALHKLNAQEIDQFKTFQESTNYFARPKTGVYYNIGFIRSISSSSLQWHIDRAKEWNGNIDVTIYKIYFDVSDAMDRNYLDSSQIRDFENIFSLAEQKGISLIPVPVYINGYEPNRNNEPNVNDVLGIIDDFYSLCDKYQHVIYTMQLGLIGAWGEEYRWDKRTDGSAIPSSLEYPKNRRKIFDRALQKLPKGLALRSRSMKYSTVLSPDGNNGYNNLKSVPTTETTAYTNSISKFGYFSDSLCKGGMIYENEDPIIAHESSLKAPWPRKDGSHIKFWKDQEELLKSNCKWVPFGGEPDGASGSWINNAPLNYEELKTYGSYRSLSDINYFGISDIRYLLEFNSKYASDKGAEFKRKIGYNLSIKKMGIEINQNNLKVELDWKNIGYSGLHHKRPLFLVLSSVKDNRRVYIWLSSDIRKQTPRGGDFKKISYTVNRPSNLVSGKYTVSLWLPDSNEIIRNNSDFAIRLGNSDISWDNDGLNNLNWIIEIGEINDFPSKAIGRMEAEYMKKVNFMINDWGGVSNQKIVKLKSPTNNRDGELTYRFTGESGSYNIAIKYRDGNYGYGNYKLQIAHKNGNVRNYPPNGWYSNLRNKYNYWRTRTEQVWLSKNCIIKLRVKSFRFEPCRIDYVEVSPINRINENDSINSNKFDNNHLSLYPNPAKAGDYVQIKTSGDDFFDNYLNLYDVKGKILFKENVRKSRDYLRFKLPRNISKGIYYLKIRYNSDIKTYKLLVE